MEFYQNLGLVGIVWMYLITVTTGRPSPDSASNDMTMDDAMGYLEKYHYMGKNHPDPKMRDMMDTNMTMAVHSGVMMFQEMFSGWGLNMTGELDKETLELMAMDRCGMPDIENMGDMMKRRKKRYLLQGGKWDHTDITYKVTQYPADGDMTPEDVDSQILLAFRVWEKVSPLRFYRLHDTSTTPDIYIKFVPTFVDHGDGYPFDGESGTLAHAFYPQGGDIGGDAHFDEAETWTLNTPLGINLFLVAAHEIGHSLGLGHSGDPQALMAPFYAGYTPADEFELSADDIAGIQAKYPLPVVPETPVPTIKPPTPQPTVKAGPPPTMPSGMMDVCKEGVLDAMTTILIGGDHKTVAFRDEYYFMIEDSGGILPGYPKMIQNEWPELPSNLDDAVFLEAQYEHEWIWNEKDAEWVLTKVETKKANTLFFKGDQYWMMEEGKIKPGFPRNMQHDLGFPKDVDAVFQWKQNGDVYVFKGEYYYRYEDGVGFRNGYPKHISVWGSIPNKLDSVFQHRAGNGSTIFFAGNQYYFYDDDKYEVKEGYPTETEPDWLQCDRYNSGNVHSIPYTAILLALSLCISRHM